ncbi:hypothetical protein KSF_000480 [Reticulibacter mediterranei]|uniref:Uncharacterized protein n=1 Tax=Reticulibacter mediterranei TaxID=2778369 RepID=A0A8J3IFX5_9CHLR|nr:DUF6585 family protein [Reticulibacter mediterranei]GHO90000.1 hypothetical protein KSF_000480 [Reticulibacter mediterranei]
MAQQQAPVQPGESNPATLATTYRLGSVVSQYKSATGSIIFRNMLLALLGILCMATIFSGFSSTTLVLFLFGVIMLSYAISRISVAQRNRGTSIYICTEGLMRIAANSVEAARWDEISEIWMHSRRSFMASTWYASRYTLDTYALRRADGSEIIIDKAFGKFKQLGKDLKQRMTGYLLPRLLATYNTGQVVQFGEIAVSIQGISLQNGQKLVAWSELHYIRPVTGFLHIHWKKQGQASYSNERILMSTIPNVFILQALVEQIKTAVPNKKRDSE